MTRYRRIRKIGFIEIAFVFWIVSCMYVWLVSTIGSGYSMRRFPSRVVSVIEMTRERIWPCIWRQYIYADQAPKRDE